MPRFAIIAREDKKDERGTVPLYLRIYHEGQVRYRSLGQRVPSRHWNANKEEVRATHPLCDSLNGMLRQRLLDAEAACLEHMTAHPYATCGDLVGAIEAGASGGDDFLAYCDKYLDRLYRRKKSGTWKHVRSIVEKLKIYHKKHHTGRLTFSRLTVTYIVDYQTYLMDTLGNELNTTTKDLQKIGAILKAAIREGLFPQEKNPFFQITLKTEKTYRFCLSRSEMETFRQMQGSAKMRLAQALFVFAREMWGMRFSDVALLRRDAIRDEHLHYVMKKTGEQMIVPVSGEAKDIMERFGTGEAGYVFPLLPKRHSDPFKRDHEINKANARTNRHLFKMGERMGLPDRLSFHIARHTFSNDCLLDGWDVFDIMRFLGHSDLKTTQRYLSGFRSYAQAERYRRRHSPQGPRPS